MIYRALLSLVVLIHWLVALGNITALPFLFVLIIEDITLWCIYLPLATFIGVITFSRTIDCPLTNLENKIRKKLNLEPIQGFVKHYALKPYCRAKRRFLSIRGEQTKAKE